jgi:hypothetical protein
MGISAHEWVVPWQVTPRSSFSSAARNPGRCEALAVEPGHGARGVAIDVAAQGLAQTLRQLGVELSIHTAGPFQVQG